MAMLRQLSLNVRRVAQALMPLAQPTKGCLPFGLRRVGI